LPADVDARVKVSACWALYSRIHSGSTGAKTALNGELAMEGEEFINDSLIRLRPALKHQTLPNRAINLVSGTGREPFPNGGLRASQVDL